VTIQLHAAVHESGEFPVEDRRAGRQSGHDRQEQTNGGMERRKLIVSIKGQFDVGALKI
jgi:hypothetical protein